MRTRIYIHERVLAYQRALPPETRRAVKAALLVLPAGDIIPLREDLDGFHRLRVGEHRFVWYYRPGGIHVFFAERRKVVYEFVAAHPG